MAKKWGTTIGKDSGFRSSGSKKSKQWMGVGRGKWWNTKKSSK
jgi:hypothetical protein